jgi:hypothetical protein
MTGMGMQPSIDGFENVFNGKYFRLVFPSLIESLSSVLVLQFQLCLLR